MRGRCFGNPHSQSPASAASTELIERARVAALALEPLQVDPGPHAARGPGGTSAAEVPAAAAHGTCAVDVTSYLPSKLKALTQHRTQYPIVPSMLPQRLLERMLGTEFFLRIPAEDTADHRQVLTPARRA